MRSSAASADAAYRADGGDGARWRVRGATVAGVRHRIDGRRGDDAFAWAALGDGGVVLAVADGVSATSQAAKAAEVAVAAACSGALADQGASADRGGGDAAGGGTAGGGTPGGGTPGGGTPGGGTPGGGTPGGGTPGVVELSPAQRCQAALDAAQDAVVAAVGDVATGATTLVVGVVAADGRWALLRVGDSDALMLTGAGEWRPVFGGPEPAENDGMRTGATDALPGAGTRRQDAEGYLQPGEVLVLLTDGVGGPLVDGPATVARGLAEGLASPPSPLELALLIDFARQGCHDDRTLLALWPAAAGPGVSLATPVAPAPPG